MDTTTAAIRAYDHEQDHKLLLFYVGRQHMEPLASANHAATTSPWLLAIWIALSSVSIQYFDWWPKQEHGYLGYLSPLPAFAAIAVPIMFFVDWRNRPYFDSQSVQALQRPDVVDLQAYYARSAASGIWLLNSGKNFVGLIAVDASLDSQSDETIVQKGRDNAETRQRQRQRQKYDNGTAQVATIRHLYVYESYRKADAQRDLIQYAVNHTFNANNAVQSIRTMPSPYSKYIGQALRAEGFRMVAHGERIGLLGWKSVTYEITRESWKSARGSQ